mmetsp:Transcript_88588/g.147836  ORF Transcript_88588/g.147836 Transcript_88588/m.147836 type:complete len:85 (+) Transcript_88588:1116-1370(+)
MARVPACEHVHWCLVCEKGQCCTQLFLLCSHNMYCEGDILRTLKQRGLATAVTWVVALAQIVFYKKVWTNLFLVICNYTAETLS